MTINRLALLLALPQVTVVSSLAYKNVTDDYISDSVRQKLAADSVVKGGAIKVDVKDGAVTLSGSVQEPRQKSKAEKLAKKVSGVKSVVNDIKIEHP